MKLLVGVSKPATIARARRACQIVLSVAFLFVLGATPRAAFADTRTFAGALKFSPINSMTPLALWSSTIADFNADGRPDVATADRMGRRGSSRYRIDVRLSNNRVQLITFVSTVGDVRIRAIDVDHDHDMDLVATPLVGQHVIGVWLNDGSGHFVESHSTSVPTDALSGSAGTLDHQTFIQVAAMPPPRRRSLQAASLRVPHVASIASSVIPRREQARALSSASARPSSPRAPPVSLLQL